MKKILILVLAGLCLFLSLRCGKGVNSPQTGQFIINGALVKDMTNSQDIVEFIVRRDSVLFDSAIVTVDGDTIASYGYGGRYYRVTLANKLHPKDTLNIVISSPSDSVVFTKNIIMPDTFHITYILPNRDNPGGETRNIYWTLSQYTSGYFVVVSCSSAVGHNKLVDYNSTQETIDPSAFRTSQGGIVPGTYSVYVVSYRESFISYTGIPFSLPSGLPSGNINGASGTIGAGVIAPKDYIIVP